MTHPGPARERIPPFTSWFLDLLRGLSALGVMLCHICTTQMGGWADRYAFYGHHFVVVFFVLSGYVIAATSDPAGQSWRRYAALRLARLWSALLPALVLAAALNALTDQVNPAFHQLNTRSSEAARYFVSAVFANEMWFYNLAPIFVAPLWSLSYEASYYLLFGVWSFMRAGTLRWIVLAAAVALVGPKILALLPVWLLGVAAWRWRERVPRQFIAGLTAIIIGVDMSALAVGVLAPLPAGFFETRWLYSSAAISDLVNGIGIALVIVGVDRAWGTRPAPRLLDRPARALAGMSLSLYVLHFPLMMFLGAVVIYDHRSLGPVAGLVLVVLAASALFAWMFEPRRRWLARVIERCLP